MSDKKRVVIAMKESFRVGLTAVYEEAIRMAGANPIEVKPHMEGSATVQLTEADWNKVKAHYSDTLLQLSLFSNKGNVTIALPKGIEFLLHNRPTLTDEERTAKPKEAGKRSETRESMDAMKQARLELKKKLLEIHGIDKLGDDDTE